MRHGRFWLAGGIVGLLTGGLIALGVVQAGRWSGERLPVAGRSASPAAVAPGASPVDRLAGEASDGRPAGSRGETAAGVGTALVATGLPVLGLSVASGSDSGQGVVRPSAEGVGLDFAYYLDGQGPYTCALEPLPTAGGGCPEGAPAATVRVGQKHFFEIRVTVRNAAREVVREFLRGGLLAGPAVGYTAPVVDCGVALLTREEGGRGLVLIWYGGGPDLTRTNGFAVEPGQECHLRLTVGAVFGQEGYQPLVGPWSEFRLWPEGSMVRGAERVSGAGRLVVNVVP